MCKFSHANSVCSEPGVGDEREDNVSSHWETGLKARTHHQHGWKRSTATGETVNGGGYHRFDLISVLRFSSILLFT
jgi:hypothetical protein